MVLPCLRQLPWLGLRHHRLLGRGFQPGDARTARAKHLGEDTQNGRLILDRSADGRAKTEVAVIGTLSRLGDAQGEDLPEGARHRADGRGAAVPHAHEVALPRHGPVS